MPSIPAQAADLPVRAAAPVDYVRVCPAQGTGFFFIPGTETCLRIGGLVRVEARFDERRATTVVPARDQNDFEFFARGQAFFDARTATEFGTLRSFVRINADRPVAAATGSAYLDQGFIQFAGLTAGRITSFFDFWGGNLARGGLQGDATTELFAYTATFGGGFSATVSVENPRRVGAIYGGRNLPDLVANLNVAQAWGSAQIMGALHQIRPSSAVVAGTTIGDKTGWAIGAGVTVNLPMLAPGSALWLQGVYADGALGYVGIGGAREFRRVDFAGFQDAYVVGGSLRNTKAWLVSAAIRHFWTPAVWSDLQGSWGQVDAPTGSGARDTTLWQVGKRINWRPAAGLTFAGEVTYTEGRRARFVADPATFRRTDSRWGATIRVQRDF